MTIHIMYVDQHAGGSGQESFPESDDMKYVCGIIGILFIFVGNYLPVPDPGLGTALFICGASLCLSALATEIHPFLDMMLTEDDLFFPPPKPQQAPAPTPEG